MPLQANPAGGAPVDGENVGTNGVGVYKQKSLGKLQLKKISTGSSTISITDDVANDEIDVTFLPAQLDHGAIGGLGEDDHSAYILVAGTRAFTGNQSMGGFKVTSLGAPSANTDATNKYYVDGAIGSAIATAPNTHTSLSDIGENTHDEIDDFMEAMFPHAINGPYHSGFGNVVTYNIGTLSGTIITGADTRLTDSRAPTQHAIEGALHSGQVNHLSLTSIGTNTHAQIDTFIGTKAQASGLASLDSGSKVVQDPTNAQTTPAISKIPIAGAGGVLASGWIPVSVTQASNADTLDGMHASDLEAVLDHGSLLGLTDDDHTQYIKHSLADAANDFLVASGDNVFVKKTLAETNIILTPVSGTQSVNSDKLDGYHYSDFSAYLTDSRAPTAHAINGVLHTGFGNVVTYNTGTLSGTIITGADARLTDSRAPTQHAIDGVLHSGTLVSVTQSVNSDTLDGSHAAAFQTALTTGNMTASSPIAVDQTRQVIGGAVVLSHVSTAGNIHLPTGGSSNQLLKNSGTSGTGSWGTVTESSGALGAVTTLSMTDILYSGKPTGAAPFAIASTTVVTNLNADALDGYHGSTTAGSNIIPVAGTDSRIAVGFVPISLTTHQANNADQLDGFHRSDMLVNFIRITVSASAPVSPSTNDLWIDTS